MCDITRLFVMHFVTSVTPCHSRWLAETDGRWAGFALPLCLQKSNLHIWGEVLGYSYSHNSCTISTTNITIQD